MEEGTGGTIVKNNLFLAFMAILMIVGIGLTVWVIFTPDLPLWTKILFLK